MVKIRVLPAQERLSIHGLPHLSPIAVFSGIANRIFLLVLLLQTHNCHIPLNIEDAVPNEYDLYILGSQLLSFETIPFPYTYFWGQKYEFYLVLQNLKALFIR